MKVTKAIEVGQTKTIRVISLNDPELAKAFLLGLEALKRLAFNRQHYPTNDPELLPGETPEQTR